MLEEVHRRQGADIEERRWRETKVRLHPHRGTDDTSRLRLHPRGGMAAASDRVIVLGQSRQR